jgi:hypothetical protein
MATSRSDSNLEETPVRPLSGGAIHEDEAAFVPVSRANLLDRGVEQSASRSLGHRCTPPSASLLLSEPGHSLDAAVGARDRVQNDSVSDRPRTLLSHGSIIPCRVSDHAGLLHGMRHYPAPHHGTFSTRFRGSALDSTTKITWKLCTRKSDRTRRN